MKTLVINTGSSSIKFALYNMPAGEMIASGLVEQIGESSGHLKMQTVKGDYEEHLAIPDHHKGLGLVTGHLMHPAHGVISDVSEIAVVGHRVVLGGEAFTKTTRINREVKDKIRELIPLAPLHNPSNLEGIEVAESVFPEAEQVAVFDTAFHQTLPPHAYRYALPNELYERYGVRVYGYHGTSHRYITKVTARYLGKAMEEVNLITVHLGNGCSMAAVKNGRSIDTSLGMTPLTGLIMGTRSGDLDPGVLIYLEEHAGYSAGEVKRLLYKESGMKGITGENDFRAITEMARKGDENARLALAMYAYRIRKYIGSYFAVLESHPDAVVFTAGVGENSALVRQMACSGMQHLGLIIDDAKNEERSKVIRTVSAANSPVKIIVAPTNEELEIARQSYELVTG